MCLEDDDLNNKGKTVKGPGGSIYKDRWEGLKREYDASESQECVDLKCDRKRFRKADFLSHRAAGVQYNTACKMCELCKLLNRTHTKRIIACK
jgi:hypothetical protein